MTKDKATRPLSAIMASVLLWVMAAVSSLFILATARFPSPPSGIDWGVVAIPTLAAIAFATCAFAVLKGYSWARTASAVTLGVAGLFTWELLIGIMTLGIDLAGDGDVILLFVAAFLSIPPFASIVVTSILLSQRSADDWYRTDPRPITARAGARKWLLAVAVGGLLVAIASAAFVKHAQYVQNGAQLTASRSVGLHLSMLASAIVIAAVTLTAGAMLSRQRESGRFFAIAACAATFAFPFATVSLVEPPPWLFNVGHLVCWVLAGGVFAILTHIELGGRADAHEPVAATETVTPDAGT